MNGHEGLSSLADMYLNNDLASVCYFVSAFDSLSLQGNGHNVSYSSRVSSEIELLIVVANLGPGIE